MLINDVSKASLWEVVAIYNNLEATISPRPLNLSIILSDTQRSVWEIASPRTGWGGAAGALNPSFKALKLDYNTAGCS